jgi:hypothetical protein
MYVALAEAISLSMFSSVAATPIGQPAQSLVKNTAVAKSFMVASQTGKHRNCDRHEAISSSCGPNTVGLPR